MGRGGKRKGAGRKPGGRPEMKHVGFRADAESRRLIRDTATAHGKTVSEFVRDAVVIAMLESSALSPTSQV
jgi:hypothetical protein